MSGPVLVVDVGTSGVRASVVRPDASVTAVHYRRALPVSPAPGLVEFEPLALTEAALGVAREALAEGGPVAAVGIANQRASTIVWDRATGVPVVLNTSFNLRGEPIVNTPREAYSTFARSEMDALVLGNCIVKKPGGTHA